MANNKRAHMLDFEKMIQRGENLKGASGFQAQTVNGTAYWKGSGWNRNEPWSQPELPPDATRPEGRNNRTGE